MSDLKSIVGKIHAELKKKRTNGAFAGMSSPPKANEDDNDMPPSPTMNQNGGIVQPPPPGEEPVAKPVATPQSDDSDICIIDEGNSTPAALQAHVAGTVAQNGGGSGFPPSGQVQGFNEQAANRNTFGN